MYTIKKTFEFAAAHSVQGLPETHKCSRLHGHNYTVEVTLRSLQLDEIGFVRDYGDLDYVGDLLKANFDHRNLNEILNVNPTAENIAYFLYRVFKREYPELYMIGVSESPKTWAYYYE